MNEIWGVRTHEKMKEVLWKPDAEGPDVHYYMIRGGSEKKNITVWEKGTVGGEYIKTYGHYHVDDLPERYWIIEGTGIALLQKMKDGKIDELEEFKVVPVKAGDILDIPVRYGHLVVNTGSTWFVTSDDSPVAMGKDSASMPVHADYSAVKDMGGFAYFVVEHEGKPALVKNSRYKSIDKEELAGLPVVNS